MPRQPLPFASPTLPGDRTAVLEAAKRALKQGEPVRARQLLAAPLRARPDDPAMLGLAALAHRELGDPLGALALFERALSLAPDLAPARLAYAETLIETNRAPQAIAALDALPEAMRCQRRAALARASALGKIGDQHGEVAVLGAFAAENPGDSGPRLRLGHALRALGETDRAIAEYRAVVADRPHHGSAWWSLANSKSVRFDEADRAAMRAALADPALEADDRIRLGFALGRAEELAGEHAESFRLYADANARRHTGSKHDPDRFEQGMVDAARLFDAEFFASRPDHGCRSEAPIFVVGMQRSGSTLVEQMLASHPAIEGTAELPHISQLSREVRRDSRLAGRSFEQQLASLDAAQARHLGESYLDRAAAHRHSDRPLFIDKMPNNWSLLGFIRLILPNARVIDVRRNPMACGFSNFRQFYAVGLDHCYSLEGWGRYYRTYLGFLAHFDAVQPGWVTRLIYEALVDDPEPELRRLADRLGIAFDPAMLDFHANARTVRTISAGQVRRPLHRGALEEWRNFEPWLGPLADALGPARDDWEGTT
ncbi:MAG: sulfotransferase [Pseudomonadota bacterium]|nr:sulfotransferase [Pseudomonadota bacterium]